MGKRQAEHGVGPEETYLVITTTDSNGYFFLQTTTPTGVGSYTINIGDFAGPFPFH